MEERPNRHRRFEDLERRWRDLAAEGVVSRDTATSHLLWLDHDRRQARRAWETDGAPRRRADDQS